MGENKPCNAVLALLSSKVHAVLTRCDGRCSNHPRHVPAVRRLLSRRMGGGPRLQVRQRGVQRLRQEHGLISYRRLGAPQALKSTNAKVERANGVIRDTLCAYANGRKDNWDDHPQL